MPTRPLDSICTDEELLRVVEFAGQHRTIQLAADAAGMKWRAFNERLKLAARRGLIPPAEKAMPGFEVKSVARKVGDAWVKQVRAAGEEFATPEGHRVKGVSALVDAEGRTIQQWIKTTEDADRQAAVMRAVVDGLKDEIAPAVPVAAPQATREDLLSQYTITDLHLGALAWNEETRRGDWDLSIGEKMLVDWFAAAIATSPPSAEAVFAQLGDFLHYDSFKSITPEHGHQLDADSRYPKMVRAAIKVLRRVMAMLLEKHERVHVIMADANHDPVAGVWLREMFATFYEGEPRVSVDTSPGTYLCHEFGANALFYHHGHRRGVKNLDAIMAGLFREVYGRTKFAYCHTGHKHSDELLTTNLMKVEQHETLAAPDAYGANWLSGRSAKVIHYHREHGEVGRNTITAAMVMQ
jgi:uncharacterized protein (DUF736 family)